MTNARRGTRAPKLCGLVLPLLSVKKWAGALPLALLVAGCQSGDPESALELGRLSQPGAAAPTVKKARRGELPQVAEDLYFIRLPTPIGASVVAMDSLRGLLARHRIAVEHEYSDLVGLAGTVSVQASSAQVQALLRERPDLEARAAVWRYPDAVPCGDGTCGGDEMATSSRGATCSLDCGVVPLRADRDELANSWHTTLVGADQVWSDTRGEGVHVAVLDTGYDRGPASVHPDRPQNMGAGYNFPAGSTDYTQVDPHGTHVAGIIAAPRNMHGTVGIAPGATIHVYNVFRSSFGRIGAADSDIIAALEAAIRNGYHIVNMSLGGGADSELEHRAIQKANNSGMLVVVAAGNAEDFAGGATKTAPRHYPGAYPESFSVGATTRTDSIAAFSSTGSTVSISAPGDGVYSSVPMGLGDREAQVSVLVAGAAMKRSVTASAPEGGSGTGVREVAIAACGFGSVMEMDACSPAGKVALIQRGPGAPGMTAIPFTDKITNARMKGAVGVMLYNHRYGDAATAGALLQNISIGTALPIPVVTLSAGDGEFIADQILVAKKDVTATIDIIAGDYADYSGTSMAAPVVSGVAALIWSKFLPSMTNVELRQLLAESAIDLGAPGRDDFFGWGRIDARRALLQARPRARCGDGRLDAASEYCDTSRVRGQTCDDYGFDGSAGGAVQCNRFCTALDATGCLCLAGRAKFALKQTLSENVTIDGVKGTLAVYHVDLAGKPVRGAYAKVHVKLRGGMNEFDYTLGPTGDSGDLEDFTPYDGTGMPPGDYDFSPVITKGAARCHDDQAMMPVSYVVKVSS